MRYEAKMMPVSSHFLYSAASFYVDELLRIYVFNVSVLQQPRIVIGVNYLVAGHLNWRGQWMRVLLWASSMATHASVVKFISCDRVCALSAYGVISYIIHLFGGMLPRGFTIILKQSLCVRLSCQLYGPSDGTADIYLIFFFFTVDRRYNLFL